MTEWFGWLPDMGGVWACVWQAIVVLFQHDNLSNVGLFLVATIVGVNGYRQANATRLFELVNYLQDERFRTARRIVAQEIARKSGTKWWEEARLEAAASDCTGHFEVVGNLVRYTCGERLRRFLISRWSESIVRAFNALEPFLKERQMVSGSYPADFDWLYRKALPHCKKVPKPFP